MGIEKSCFYFEHLDDGLQSEACRRCCGQNLAGFSPRKQEKKTPGMDNETFTRLVEEIREKSLDTLLKKNANYGNEDRLHNFRVGASIVGGTPAQAALGYMAKHLASLQDKVLKNDFHDREDLLEKCQDIINYIVFIWCCGNEHE